MSILRRFEREVDEKVRKLFASPAGQAQGKEIVEIHRGILDDVVGKVQPPRRGKRGFPYNHLVVHIPVPDPARRAVFAMTFVDGDALTADLREALIEAGCDPPADLRAEVVLSEHDIPDAAARGFHIVYQRRDPAPPEPQPFAGPARLTILTGKSVRQVHDIPACRVNIGRLDDVLDEQHRLVRRNNVVFEDTDDAATATVSRAHGHIEFDAESGEYRLFDDRSAYGTTLFRGGALIHVPPGPGRGVALRSGDEIYFGRASARFEILTNR